MASKPSDGPVEAFRQVTAAAMRAIAHEPELQVTFAPEPAVIRGNDVRLPVPSREMAKEEVAVIRGEADAMSLRLRFHDEKLHRKRAPSGAMARQVFNAVEQARCEARGARRMSGTAQNLAAAVECTVTHSNRLFFCRFVTALICCSPNTNQFVTTTFA